jgi:hypothetical protein
VRAIEQGKESESGDSGYTGCGRLKVPKTILMIVLQVARDVRVGEKGWREWEARMEVF